MKIYPIRIDYYESVFLSYYKIIEGIMFLTRINYRYMILASGGDYFILDTKPSTLREYLFYFLLWRSPRKLKRISETEYNAIHQKVQNSLALPASLVGAGILGSFLARNSGGDSVLIYDFPILVKVILVLLLVGALLLFTELLYAISKKKLKQKFSRTEPFEVRGNLIPVKNNKATKNQIIGYSILSLLAWLCLSVYLFTGVVIALVVWFSILTLFIVFGGNMAFSSDKEYDLKI